TARRVSSMDALRPMFRDPDWALPLSAPTRRPTRVEKRMQTAQHDSLREQLIAARCGEVRFDTQARALYATDSSNYRQVPIGVVIPRSLDDVVRTIGICRQHNIHVTSRGGGTS